ncbi:MAG: amidohydrolase family protein, partial [Acidimicrobiales bacterium]
MTTPASLALVGGRVLSSAHDSGYARALAVCDGAIVAIGRDDEVAELVGPRTRVVDLRGRLVVPSFGDAHVHAANAALEGLRCNLLGLRTRDDCLDAIAAHCARLGPDEWVLGGGWSLDTFPGGPTAADLDAACAGRPAFLPNRDHHSAWVST